MKKYIYILFAFVAIISAVSCSKSSDSKTPTTPGPTPTKVLTAKVNGATWTGTTGIAVTLGSPLWNLMGSTSDNTIHIVIYSFNGVGTYNINGAAAQATYGPFTTPTSAVNGTITITSSTASNVKGTFYYTTTDSVHVTDGSFDVDF